MSKGIAGTEFEHFDIETVVVFVDMSGFTALTEAHGDHHAAQVAEAFAAMAIQGLGPDDDLVKTIGDAVMVTSPDPTAALAFLTRLTDATRSTGCFPMLRAGVSAGPVVKRRGDIYGATVNKAARLAALAEAGQIVTDGDVAATARRSGLLVESLGSVRLRNIGSPIDAVIVDAGKSHQDHVDPVCRMHIAASAPTAVSDHGHAYRFCSITCALEFASRPDDYKSGLIAAQGPMSTN